MSGYLLGWPGWAVMWMLAFAIYAGCKWLTWRGAAIVGAPAWKHVAYLLAWPGMDAEGFLGDSDQMCSPCRSREWVAATGKLTLGLTLLFGVARTIPSEQPYVAGWIGMIGLVLVAQAGLRTADGDVRRIHDRLRLGGLAVEHRSSHVRGDR